MLQKIGAESGLTFRSCLFPQHLPCSPQKKKRLGQGWESQKNAVLPVPWGGRASRLLWYRRASPEQIGCTASGITFVTQTAASDMAWVPSGARTSSLASSVSPVTTVLSFHFLVCCSSSSWGRLFPPHKAHLLVPRSLGCTEPESKYLVECARTCHDLCTWE